MAFAENELSPYFKVGDFKGTVEDAVVKVETSLKDAGFEMLANYKPENKPGFMVLVYSNKALQQTCLKVKERGALAAALKVGFMNNNGVVEVTMINPEYLFNAYLQENFENYKTQLLSISESAKKAISIFGGTLTPFGGKIELDDLREYQYMWGMEEFTDPVELMEFKSFDEGLATINRNLNAGKGNCIKVYEMTFRNEKVAVFGVGLMDKESGEPFFLPIIGETHLAAMPYEIILQGNIATMLHGRFRIALHWPELTMTTFTKIMSTPGDVEDALEGLCK